MRNIVQWFPVISMFQHCLFILYGNMNFMFFLDFQRDEFATIWSLTLTLNNQTSSFKILGRSYSELIMTSLTSRLIASWYVAVNVLDDCIIYDNLYKLVWKCNMCNYHGWCWMCLFIVKLDLSIWKIFTKNFSQHIFNTL